MTSLLSAKTIDPRDRLIVALDLPDAAAARALVTELGDAVVFYKIGLELFMTGGYFDLLNWLVSQGKKVFVDRNRALSRAGPGRQRCHVCHDPR
jgi:orotidine-5'-phosphate decarboxylase